MCVEQLEKNGFSQQIEGVEEKYNKIGFDLSPSCFVWFLISKVGRWTLVLMWLA